MRARAGHLLVGGLLSPGRPGHRARRLPRPEGVLPPDGDRRVPLNPFRMRPSALEPLGRDRGPPGRPPPRPLPRLRRHPLADGAPPGARHPAGGDAGAAAPPRRPLPRGHHLRPRPGGRGRPGGLERSRLRRQPRLRHRRPAGRRRSAPLRLEVGEGIPEKIERAAERLRRDLDGVEGVLIEPKRFAISIHFRLADERDLPRDRARGRRRPGRRARPAQGARQEALRAPPRPRLGQGAGPPLAPRRPRPRPPRTSSPSTSATTSPTRTPSAPSPGRGIGILVAGEPRETAAEYQLRDTEEVVELLERLLCSRPAQHDLERRS